MILFISKSISDKNYSIRKQLIQEIVKETWAFTINALSVEQMHGQLAILLSSDIKTQVLNCWLLMNTYILEIPFKRQWDKENQTKSKYIFSQNQKPLSVVWDERQERKLYIWLFIENNEDGTVRIDHLEIKRA